jgi:hypothetical protein
MSLDPRSRERLEALGRQLPKPLPPPPEVPAAAAPPAATRRHRVETEQDPRRLFHELMDVSPDGSVPPHLLDRLRQLEKPAAAAGAAPAAASPPSPRRPRRQRGSREPDQDLYTAFRQLLLEDEEED